MGGSYLCQRSWTQGEIATVGTTSLTILSSLQNIGIPQLQTTKGFELWHWSRPYYVFSSTTSEVVNSRK